MPSSWMLRHVTLVRTDVSEERSASIIRVTRIGELGMLAVTTNLGMLLANCHPDDGDTSSETSVFTKATRHNISEDGILHCHDSESLKSYAALTGWALQRRCMCLL
jgi:hypothetical protein